MLLIPGIIASSKLGAVGDFESIATVTVTGATQAEIEFANIPGTFQHLQLRGLARANFNSSPGLSLYLVFNSDTGSNYSSHLLRGSGAAVEVAAATSDSKVFFPRAIPDTNANANMLGGSVADILDYKDSNKYKTVRILGCYDTNNTTSGNISLVSGLWQSTSAITNIKITTDGSFTTNTSFALYGIKG